MHPQRHTAPHRLDMHTSASWDVVALVAIALWSSLCGARAQVPSPCSVVGQWQQVGLGSGASLAMTFNSTRVYTFNVSVFYVSAVDGAHSHLNDCGVWGVVRVAGNVAHE
jgi:hypothetical protein